LFEGSEVEGQGGACGGGNNATPSFLLKFDDSKNLSINYVCEDLADPFDVKGSGIWKIENNKLCLKASSKIQFWKNQELSGENCWTIEPSKKGFTALNSKGDEDWTISLKSHPKHSTKEELYAALVNVSGGTQIAEKKAEPKVVEKKQKQNSDKALLAEIKRLKQEAKAARKASEARNKKEAAKLKSKKEAEEKRRLAILEKKKKQESARKKTAKLKRKKEAEEKRRIAILEKKKKQESARKKTAELKHKKKVEEKQRLAAKASAGEKDGGARSTLKERMATLKDLKDAGLLSEKEFQANKRAVLNEFLGLGGASKVASQNAPARKAKPRKYADVKFGKYYALIIGNNDYKHLPKLKTAAKDAKAVAKTLRDIFGFEVKTLINATRSQILDAFDDYQVKLGKTDNFLLYYAGHGWLDKGQEQGFWLPVNAKTSRRSQWISNATVTSTLKALQAKHVMVVADSCFSGTLTRGLKVEKRIDDYVREVVGRKARIALTSGGLEPVEDGGGGKNSPFASAFLKILNGSDEVLSGTELFKRVKRPVQVNADQTPNYSDIRKAGHDGGDFLFVRKR
jgi:hypothetical protein